MKSAVKLRLSVGQRVLRINTCRDVRGRRGSTTRHCSLSSKVAGPMPEFALNVEAMFDGDLMEILLNAGVPST